MVDMNYYTSAAPRDQEAIIFKRSGTFFIKRVIAHGGEFVSGKGSLIRVNGQVLNEPYTQHIDQPEQWMTDFGPVVVPAGEFFVMGDNRDIRLDSRSQGYGFVTSASIVGKPLYVVRSDRSGQTIN